MRHFTCDSCGEPFSSPQSMFTWVIEAGPASTMPDTNDPIDPNPDSDCIDEMDELLAERAEESSHDHSGDTVEMLPISVRREYTVCGHCYRRLLSDPLAREFKRDWPYSRN